MYCSVVFIDKILLDLIHSFALLVTINLFETLPLPVLYINTNINTNDDYIFFFTLSASFSSIFVNFFVNFCLYFYIYYDLILFNFYSYIRFSHFTVLNFLMFCFPYFIFHFFIFSFFIFHFFILLSWYFDSGSYRSSSNGVGESVSFSKVDETR